MRSFATVMVLLGVCFVAAILALGVQDSDDAPAATNATSSVQDTVAPPEEPIRRTRVASESADPVVSTPMRRERRGGTIGTDEDFLWITLAGAAKSDVVKLRFVLLAGLKGTNAEGSEFVRAVRPDPDPDADPGHDGHVVSAEGLPNGEYEVSVAEPAEGLIVIPQRTMLFAGQTRSLSILPGSWDGEAAEGEAAAGTVRVAGRVVDADGEPFRAFPLQITTHLGTGHGASESRTDEDGRFSIDVPAAMEFMTIGSGDLDWAWVSRVVRQGEDASDLVLSARRALSTGGIVYGVDGMPLPRARLSFRVEWTRREGPPSSSTSIYARTNERGAFEVHVPEGTSRVLLERKEGDVDLGEIRAGSMANALTVPR